LPLDRGGWFRLKIKDVFKRVRKIFRFFKFSQKGVVQLPIIIGLLVIGIALPAAVTLVQRTQETRREAADPSSTCCQDASVKQITTPQNGSFFKAGDTVSISGKVNPNGYCAGAWSQQDIVKLYIGSETFNVPIKDENGGSWEKFEMGYWSYNWVPTVEGDYNIYFKFHDGSVDGGYDCPSNSINIEVTGGIPDNPVIVSCNSPIANPNPVFDEGDMTYSVGQVTTGWVSNFKRYYGETMDRAEMTGNPENQRCDAAAECLILSYGDICECEAGWEKGDKVWFFNNLSKTIDGFDYICTWDGRWSKRIPGTGWIWGEEASPGDNYVCDNNCDVSVDIRRELPTDTPMPSTSPETCLKGGQGDLDCNGAINGDDLTIMLQAMFKAPYTTQGGHSTDLTGEGEVNERDLTKLLINWTQ